MAALGSVPKLVEKIIEVLGEPRVTNQNFSWCCPFCVDRGEPTDDTRYRMALNPFKKDSHGITSKSGFFFCPRCGIKGTGEYLLQKLGIKFEADVQTWGQIMTELLASGERTPAAGETPVLETTTFPCETFMPQPGMASYKYLVEERGIDVPTIVEYGIKVGTKKLSGRVILPSYNADGEMDFWVARAYEPDVWGPKYLAAPNMPRKRRIYRYYEVLRGLRAKRFDSVVVTEGTISAIRAGRDAVATYGKYVSPEQVEMLAALQSKVSTPIKYKIALDGDALGWSMKLARKLHARGLDTSVVLLPPDHDPASLPVAEWQQLRNAPMRYDGTLSEVLAGLNHV